MAAVDLRQRRHARQQRFASPHAGALRRMKQRLGNAQGLRQRRIVPDKSGIFQRVGAKAV
jgi:hypothetical protein